MWFGWGFMFLGPLCLVLIAAAIYYVITSTSRNEGCSTHTQQPRHYSTRAIEILNERYAKGEITKEQYLQMKDEIQ
ncbi:MAG: SHOCT domain-containing protein [Candidatus Bathyarchaeota archaeon]|jgi:putative membrane protein